MAVAPLYAASLSALMTKVRVETASDAQTVAAIHQAITDVRIGFYRQLGRERAQEISAFAIEENPVSDEGTLRSTAMSAEVIWLTILLITRLPVLFMDNKASVADVFNDEPLTRDATALQSTLDDLKSQLTELLDELADDDSNIKGAGRASLNGPATTYLNSEHRVGNPLDVDEFILPAGTT